MKQVIYHGSVLTSDERFEEAEVIIRKCLSKEAVEGIHFVRPSHAGRRLLRDAKYVLITGYGSPFDYRKDEFTLGRTPLWENISANESTRQLQLLLNHCFLSRYDASVLRRGGHEVSVVETEADDSLVLFLDVLLLSLFSKRASSLDSYVFIFDVLTRYGLEFGEDAFRRFVKNHFSFVKASKLNPSLLQELDDGTFDVSTVCKMFDVNSGDLLNPKYDAMTLLEKLAHSITVMKEGAHVRPKYEKAADTLENIVGPVFGSGRGLKRKKIRVPEEKAVDVVLATTRKLGASGWTDEESNSLTYGKAKVRIPSSYKLGNRPIFQVARRIEIRPRLNVTENNHVSWEDAKSDLKDELDGPDHAILCYVHGFNTTLNESLIKAAQLRYDLGLASPMVAFSWPSLGSLTQYIGDGNRADGAVRFFALLLEKLLSIDGNAKIAVIAHSMGTKVALRGIMHALATGLDQKLSELILVASDVHQSDVGTYEPALKDLVLRSTVYASSSDRVLRFSSRLGTGQRLGYLPPIALSQYYDFVDVTDAIDGVLRHDYHLREASVITDISSALKGEATSSRRLSKLASIGPRCFLLHG